MTSYRIEHYFATDRRDDPYLRWLRRLRDRRAQIAVIRRVNRMEQGNFGDHRFCRSGVYELRIDIGPGYRVYYAQPNDERVVLLLCGGDKRTQKADIDWAAGYWQDWQRRIDDEKPHT